MTRTKQAQSEQELVRMVMQNTVHEGYGAELKTIFPCGYCGLPGLFTVRLLHTHEDMERGGTCKHCGRGIRMILTQPYEGTIEMEMVQVSGPDAPEWLTAPPRRVDEATG